MQGTFGKTKTVDQICNALQCQCIREKILLAQGGTICKACGLIEGNTFIRPQHLSLDEPLHFHRGFTGDPFFLFSTGVAERRPWVMEGHIFLEINEHMKNAKPYWTISAYIHHIRNVPHQRGDAIMELGHLTIPDLDHEVVIQFVQSLIDKQYSPNPSLFPWSELKEYYIQMLSVVRSSDPLKVMQ